MISPTPDPEWFDSRRFITVAPPFGRTDWSVDDLATNIRLVTDLTMEEAGLYSDALEERFNQARDGN